jgi:Fur family peroxide stress response transcriptional regulator
MSTATTPSHFYDRDVVARDLRAHGLRPTIPRQTILSALRRTTAHPTVDALRSMLRADGHSVGIATVYQNLDRLVDTGLVLRFLDADGLMRFDADTSAHDHLVCVVCGRIDDVHADPKLHDRASRAVAGLAKAHPDWKVERVHVELLGRCPACRDSADA